jgi:hypothetical protein
MSALRDRGFTIEPCPSLAESPPCRPLSDQEAMRRRRLPSMLSPSGVQVSTRKVKCVLVVLMSAFVERHLRLPPRTDGLLLLRSSSARRYLFGVAGPATARFAFRPFPDKITSPAATPHAGPTLLRLQPRGRPLKLIIVSAAICRQIIAISYRPLLVGNLPRHQSLRGIRFTLVESDPHRPNASHEGRGCSRAVRVDIKSTSNRPSL